MPFSESLKSRLRKRAHFLCCVCRRHAGVEIHHIVPQAEGGSDTEDNAAPLCPNCHDTYGANPEKRKLIREMRDQWYEICAKEPEASIKSGRANSSDMRNIVTVDFSGGENRGIIANKVEFKTQNKTVKMNPPSGSIASDLMCRNYAKYLIDRYHEFKKSDVGHDGMKYYILYGSIKRKFGAKWEMVSIIKFDLLSEFLQQRIDRTRLGKTRKSRGQKNYSTFQEYRDKHGG